MTKAEALRHLSSDKKIDDLILTQIREALTHGQSTPETDAKVKAVYGDSIPVDKNINYDEPGGADDYANSDSTYDSYEYESSDDGWQSSSADC